MIMTPLPMPVEKEINMIEINRIGLFRNGEERDGQRAGQGGDEDKNSMRSPSALCAEREITRTFPLQYPQIPSLN
jgi:hypothetical protein